MSAATLITGAAICGVLVSLAQGRFETVKAAYVVLVIMSLASGTLAFFGLRHDRKAWSQFCLGVLVASAVSLVFALRMVSLAYTFQMNLY